MKLVRFNRAMAPYRMGEQRVLTDDQAADLAGLGLAVIVPSVFDPQGGGLSQGGDRTPGASPAYATRDAPAKPRPAPCKPRGKG